ncbi:MAG: xylulokinase, partial [Pseudomonadota bacterium]
MNTYLGLDLGTSGLRGLLVDEGGNTLASAEADYPIQYPQPGWSEQDPQDWINAAISIFEVLNTEEPSAFTSLKGIAVSGHMHGAVVLDDNMQVLRPCIMWNDTRAEKEAAELNSDPKFRDLSGNIIFPGFTAPKLLWMARNEPEIFTKAAKVLLPAAFMNFWLTGVFCSDLSDASGSAWFDLVQADWSTDLLSATGLSVDQMPSLVYGSERIGVLKPNIADRFGLGLEVIVAGGGADNAVAACGIGAIQNGKGFLSLGTSGVILIANDAPTLMPETAVHCFAHAVPDMRYQMGVTLAATDSLNWLSRQLGKPPDMLTTALGDHLNEPSDVLFLPYLSGERTPHNDSAIRGSFLNIDVSSDVSDLTQAVLEGVAFSVRDIWEALNTAGAKADRLIAIGGGSQSRYWIELCATVLNIPLDIPEKSEFGAAMGAARLAICAATDRAPIDVMT